MSWEHLAPEYASTDMLNKRSHAYGFGILMMEIIFGRNRIDYSCFLEEILMHRSSQKWDKLYIFLKLKTPHPIQSNMLTMFLSHGASLPGSHLAYTGRKVHNMGDVDPDHLWVEHRRRYARYKSLKISPIFESSYVASEYASTCTLNKRSNEYSFGILMMEIISGRNPIDYSRSLEETQMHGSGQKWDKLCIFFKLKTPHLIQRSSFNPAQNSFQIQC
ncbi:hypothetical protein FH972_010876 [Carpinus fangiana]|uniref:non-specific serine/threonine protein kinase n=1 Tax=Carpinus fangiana TaxID=176857 RepID=A0A660KRC6_9ROSI|nr:hypothetical protein FH972_010876 [Carpinus fangiana]